MNKKLQYNGREHSSAETRIKKIMDFAMPMKMLGSMIFAGLIISYMISGVIYAYISGEAFTYAVPFAFILHGLLLAAFTSVFWGLLFSGIIVKKWRFFQRMIVFALSLMALLSVSLLTFVAIPTQWAALWLTVNACIGTGLVAFSVVSEIRFKTTGKRYTEVLNIYKASKKGE